ncbi:DUF2927 domain-containing protein [Paenirhodobacter sp.]|uniref:DUF2927 domain-containing protein n=1 Tax=Paenirhodobacter sp. TaxID=1965326 RepID=UPI003B42409A
MRRQTGIALGVAALLAGCAPLPAPLTSAPPTSGAPESSPRPWGAPGDLGENGRTVQRSPESAAMVAYYAQVERTLKSRGLMRKDVAPRDAAFRKWELVDDFVAIALYDEYDSGMNARVTPSKLRRWETPVRLAVEFGASVPEAQRAEDRAMVTAYAGQLARASRHPVGVVRTGGNFNVLVVNEDERRALGPRLQQLVPGITAATIAAITDLPPSTFCMAFAFSDGAAPVYTRAIAVIRAEHPRDLRQSCFHEELAQGLGLANDSPEARPSIFNDDEEFSLLTRHDELLLRILYDPRLRPGMTEEQARPIVQTIADELLGPDA